LTAACNALVAAANDRGGEDNITVVLAKFTGDDLQNSAGDRITIELPAMDEDKTLDETDSQHRTPEL
jgi:serine/threonine protein phosphatase PrpC